MQIGIIGAGKVGTTLGKYVADYGICVKGFYSRTEDSAKESAKFTNTKYFKTLDSLIEVSDTLFITTTDREISKVWDCIARKNVRGKVICHFSGSLSSDVFSNWEETGAYACSIHPIYAFSNKFTAYQNLTGAVFTVEGSSVALIKMQELFHQLPNQIIEISTTEKVRYHAATSIASNQVVGLIAMAVELLKESGIPEQTSYRLLKPLVENNIKSIFEEKESISEKREEILEEKESILEERKKILEEKGNFQGCAQALTGPIERNDLQTVQKHLQKMDRPQWENSYRAVGSFVAELAQKKHPERDYKKMKQLLESK